MVSKTVSIIVPIYNAEAFIDRCLDSIVHQTYQDLEIILINDGSTDESLVNCEIWCEKDDRVKLINQENAGVSAARNVGIEIASGDLLLFIDIDDYIEVNTVSLLVNQQAQTQADLIIFGFYRHFMNGTFKKNEGNQMAKSLASNEFFSQFWQHYEEEITNTPFNKLYKKQILKDHGIYFPEGITMGEDLLFNLDYLKFTDTIFISDAYLYHYIMHPNQATLKVDLDIYEDYIQFFNKIEFLASSKKVSNNFDWAHHYNQLLKHMITAMEMPYRSNTLNAREQKAQLFKIAEAFQSNFNLQYLTAENHRENVIKNLVRDNKYHQLHVYLKTIQDSKRVVKSIISITRGG